MAPHLALLEDDSGIPIAGEVYQEMRLSGERCTRGRSGHPLALGARDPSRIGRPGGGGAGGEDPDASGCTSGSSPVLPREIDRLRFAFEDAVGVESGVEVVRGLRLLE